MVGRTTLVRDIADQERKGPRLPEARKSGLKKTQPDSEARKTKVATNPRGLLNKTGELEGNGVPKKNETWLKHRQRRSKLLAVALPLTTEV